MPQIRKDTSVLEQYRERYEAGEILVKEIREYVNISNPTMTKYMANAKWDKELARKNYFAKKREPLNAEIETYREAFENGLITKTQLQKILKCDTYFVKNYIEEHKWDCTRNKERKRKNLFKRKPENENKDVLPIKEKSTRKKRTLPLIFKDIQNLTLKQITRKRFDECFPNKTVNDRIKINGVPYTIFEINKMRVKLYRRIYEEMNDPDAEKEIMLFDIQESQKPIKAKERPQSMAVKRELPLTKEDIEFQKEVYRMEHLLKQGNYIQIYTKPLE